MTRPRILIIDDDPDICNTVAANLELDGFDVTAAVSGQAGVTAVTDSSPDLVLLDLNLPDIDGIKVCQILRRNSDIPVIMLSARDTVADKLLGLECGADDYLVKPFNTLELSARVRALLRRAQRAQSSPECQIGEIVLNYRTGQVLVKGVEIHLTRTEFHLLELFMTHAGQTLNREFIQSQNWESSKLYSHSRAIDVHVQRLRKKIEPNPQNPSYIHTVAGVGYRFSPSQS
jgi:two-component system alkaline phosphatase synthesis response regulator PhoP/OmpR family response regulator RpaB